MIVLRPAAIMYTCRVHLEPGLGSESEHAPNPSGILQGAKVQKKILADRRSLNRVSGAVIFGILYSPVM